MKFCSVIWYHPRKSWCSRVSPWRRCLTYGWNIVENSYLRLFSLCKQSWLTGVVSNHTIRIETETHFMIHIKRRIMNRILGSLTIKPSSIREQIIPLNTSRETWGNLWYIELKHSGSAYLHNRKSVMHSNISFCDGNPPVAGALWGESSDQKWISLTRDNQYRNHFCGIMASLIY